MYTGIHDKSKLKNAILNKMFLQNGQKPIFFVSSKTIQFDNNLEFFLTKFYDKHGILHQISCMEMPQRNGVV